MRKHVNAAKMVAAMLALVAAVFLVPVAATADAEAEGAADAALLRETLEDMTEGEDYVAGELLVLLDGDSAMTGSASSLSEYAAAAIDDARAAGRASSLESAESAQVELAQVGPVAQLSVSGQSFEPAAAGDDALSQMGDIEFVAAGSWLEGDVVVRVEVPEGASLYEAARLLGADPRVISASPNYLYEACEGEYEGYEYASGSFPTSVNDPSESVDENKWHLDSADVYGAWSYAKAQGAVTVAVIDTGCQMNHPDLVANLDVESAWDTLTNSTLQGDYSSHGTHVAGIIAAQANNGIGAAGVSYNAKVLPINASCLNEEGERILPYGQQVAAFDYLFDLIESDGRDDIKVVNMSYGGYNRNPEVEARLFRALGDYGLTLVAAAGNDGVTDSFYPSDYDYCISVINVDQNDQRHVGVNGKGSNYGPDKDISAPGVGVYSTVPGSGYARMTGTSMAAPVVSGVAALLYAADPDATPFEVRSALLDSALDLGAEGLDDYTGFGKVDAEAAVETLLFGVDFSDVDPLSWYVVDGYFAYVLTNGIMSGYGGTDEFGPGQPLTRAELVAVLCNIGNPGWADGSSDNQTSFTDVADGQWYTAAVNWAVSEGVVSGSGGLFRPNDAVSRQEAAVMAKQFADAMGVDTSVAGMTSPPFSDWDGVASWAVEAVTWCYHSGVMGGYSDGVTDALYALPLGSLTRDQATAIATVLHRDVIQQAPTS